MNPAVQDAQEEVQDRVLKVKGVVRIDISARKQTHGWQARLYIGKKAITKFFSDSKCGGREGSFDEAVTALRQMEMGKWPKRTRRAK